MAKISNANIPAVQLVELGADFDAPAAGFIRLFAKSDGLYVIDSSSVVLGPFGPLDLGAASIGDFGDVDLSGLMDGDTIIYDSISGTFQPGAGGGGGGLSQAQVLARTLGA